MKDAKDFPQQPKPVVEKPAESTASFGEPNTDGSDSLENGNQNPQPTTPPRNEPTESIPEGNSIEATRLSEENAALKAENEALKADKLAAQRQKAGAAFSFYLDS